MNIQPTPENFSALKTPQYHRAIHAGVASLHGLDRESRNQASALSQLPLANKQIDKLSISTPIDLTMPYNSLNLDQKSIIENASTIS